MNSLHQVIDQMNKGSFPFMDGYTYSDAAVVINRMDKQIRHAICFDIGEMDDILEMNKPSTIEEINLPFQVTWFEMTVTLKAINETIRVGVLAERLSNEIAWTILQKIDQRWTLFSNILTKKIPDNNEYMEYISAPAGRDGIDVQLEKFRQAIYTSVNFYCRVLACSNIATENHKPNEHLNKKRIKKGKQPLFEYKTLRLFIPNNQTKKVSKGGTHSSPRLHMRRGHIRRYKTGKEIWIDEMMVGEKKKGFIHKDYLTKYTLN